MAEDPRKKYEVIDYKDHTWEKLDNFQKTIEDAEKWHFQKTIEQIAEIDLPLPKPPPQKVFDLPDNFVEHHWDTTNNSVEGVFLGIAQHPNVKYGFVGMMQTTRDENIFFTLPRVLKSSLLPVTEHSVYIITYLGEKKSEIGRGRTYKDFHIQHIPNSIMKLPKT